MALAFHPRQEVKKAVAYPVEDKEHLNLLPEVDFFVADELRLVVWLTCDPDENEKR